MFRAIGVVIILVALSRFFSSSFEALDKAGAQVFNTLETAAVVSETELQRNL